MSWLRYIATTKMGDTCRCRTGARSRFYRELCQAERLGSRWYIADASVDIGTTFVVWCEKNMFPRGNVGGGGGEFVNNKDVHVGV